MNQIIQANKNDIPQIVELLNITYRSEGFKKGWTTEADIIKGEIRTDEETVVDLMENKNSYFFKCINEKKELIGCVNFKKNGNRMYLGMLSVLPELQGKGIGKMFLKKAELFAKEINCQSIYMQVISIRTELNEWYIRHGCEFTGERKFFDVDEKYGKPIEPLEFIILEKKIG